MHIENANVVIKRVVLFSFPQLTTFFNHTIFCWIVCFVLLIVLKQVALSSEGSWTEVERIEKSVDDSSKEITDGSISTSDVTDNNNSKNTTDEKVGVEYLKNLQGSTYF